MAKQKAKTTAKLSFATKDQKKQEKFRLPEMHEIEFDDVVRILLGNKNVKPRFRKSNKSDE